MPRKKSLFAKKQKYYRIHKLEMFWQKVLWSFMFGALVIRFFKRIWCQQLKVKNSKDWWHNARIDLFSHEHHHQKRKDQKEEIKFLDTISSCFIVLFFVFVLIFLTHFLFDLFITITVICVYVYIRNLIIISIFLLFIYSIVFGCIFKYFFGFGYLICLFLNWPWLKYINAIRSWKNSNIQ